eukprot:1484571-Ditylum_brightwellii.AAC.1
MAGMYQHQSRSYHYHHVLLLCVCYKFYRNERKVPFDKPNHNINMSALPLILYQHVRPAMNQHQRGVDQFNVTCITLHPIVMRT